MSKELIEVFTKTEHFLPKTVEEAIKVLNTITGDIRLDYHNVLDKFSPKTVIRTKPEQSVVCISYVGRNTTSLRSSTTTDIKHRITLGQLDCGILVFIRGRGKDKNNFTLPGSKAFVNAHLKPSDRAIFLDDGVDHINSTEALEIPDLICVRVNRKSNEDKMMTAIERLMG